ncbi:BRCA2 protein, partial [Alectura lathami]|nr:BRCA2 protein [Alectura lathami]
MAYNSVRRPTFFEIFKAHCSDSDLGPISLNWFEELSLEAPPYEPKLLGELDGTAGWLDHTSFKTPKAKPSAYTQLASTPLIFKEQNTMPPFSSPGKGLDQKQVGTSSPSTTRRKADRENQIFASPLGTCHNCIAASPTILRNTCRTPQRSNIPGPYGSLFCTPKFLEIRTPKRISESLGAEVDPEMSWSSSLATPPTLGATVLIARENDSICEAKQQDERAETALHNFFSKDDECAGKNDMSLLSLPEARKLTAEDDIRDFESELLDAVFGETNSFEEPFDTPAGSSGILLLLPPALEATEKCVIKTDEAQGKGDVPSEPPISRTATSQGVKAMNCTRKIHSVEVKGSVFQNVDEDLGASKDSCLTGCEEGAESLRIAVQDDRTQKPSVKGVLSPSQWSQLNLSGLDVAHLEMSACSSLSSDLCEERDLEEEKPVLMTKDDAAETSSLSTLVLKNAQELLSANLSENGDEMKKSEKSPVSEITPVKSVHLSPKLIKGCATEKVSTVSFLNCSSFLIESTNVMEYSVVYNSSFSKHLKAASKSVVTDVLSHPLVCSAASPGTCSDLHLANSDSSLSKSSFTSLNVLSRLKKKSKRFIYTVNNTLLYQEGKVQKEVTSESPAHPVLARLGSDSPEFKGCRVARDGNQDSLISAESHSDTKENNFSTSIKMDVMRTSSGNSFSNRLQQQELRDSGENARECQPATSFKCLGESNAQQEDATGSLNSERISNIKRKVLTSACPVARKRSRFFPEDSRLEKDKEDLSMGPHVNSGAAAPRNLTGQPMLTSSSHHPAADVRCDAAAETDGCSRSAPSQIELGINKVSSGSCNKISADTRCATAQLSAVECREIVAPLGINCSENNSSALKQGGKNIVAGSQETNTVKNNESFQAAACNNVSVETAEELVGYPDENSLNEVISEEDNQAAPVYSNTKPNENLEHKRKASGGVNACSSSLSFGGFQTASNKQIKFSEDSIAKGKMLFKDIENEGFEASSMERIRFFFNQVQKEHTFSSDLESKLGGDLSGSQTRHTQLIPHKTDLCKSFPRSQQSLQEANQTLTASQEAEIAELSNILEETGSQFEFTQFRKQSNMIQSHSFQQFGETDVENVSETGKDTDFCSTVKSENQVIKDKECSEWKDTNEKCEMVAYEQENTGVFHKNNKEVTFTNLDRHGSGVSDNESFPAPIQASFSNFVGFTSAGGKKINISKAALTRSAELFKDLADDNYLFKSSEPDTGCRSSNGQMSSDWNSLRCLTREDKGEMVCVPDIKSVGAISHSGSVSHNSEKKYVGNISTPCKENTENRTKGLISDHGDVNFSCTNASCSAYGMGNGLSPLKKHHQNCEVPRGLLDQGESQAEGSLQEDSLYATCLGDDTVTSAEEHGLSVLGEMEDLSPPQKGGRKQGDGCLQQKCQAPDIGAVSISGAPLDNALHGLNTQRGERDAGVPENSAEQNANSVGVEGEGSTHENLFVSESRIKLGSYQHHQAPLEQEVGLEKNEVKGSYLTGFHTASGKKITIADGFLAKAEQFFSEENTEVGKDHNEGFEEHFKKRKCNENCVKDCDLCTDSVARCGAEVVNRKLISEEPGDQLKQALESSPTKQAMIHDSVKGGACVNVDEDCERNLVAPCANKKADVRPGKSGVESLPGQGNNALGRTPLSEDGKLFAEGDVECSAQKNDDSESKPDVPVQSAPSLHLAKESSDLADNPVPGDTKNAVFVEDSCKPDQSLLTYNTASESAWRCASTELDLNRLNEPCSNAECFPDPAVNAHQEQAEVLPEDGNNLTCKQEIPLNFNADHPKVDLKRAVFSTAGGKAVPVAESALASVRQMLQNDCDGSVQYKIEPKSGTNHTGIAGNSPFSIRVEGPNSAMSFDARRNEMTLAASRFISGNVNPGENSHQEADMFADADYVPDSQMQCSEQNSKLLGPLPVPDKQVKQPDPPAGSLGFFSTASGKPVQLSEESLKKARQLFSETEGSHLSGLQEALLGEEGVEKSEKHTEIFPWKMQVTLPKGRGNSSTALTSDPALGFSTASGKQVTVSDNAYQKAKAILKDSDDFFSNELGAANQLREIKESGQCAKSSTGKVISERKMEKSCNGELALRSVCPEEMKPPSTHRVRMPEHVPHGKRDSQPASSRNSCQQEEAGSLGTGQLHPGIKTEPEAASCGATSRAGVGSLLFQTPKSYLKAEAAESAKAFMEDELSGFGAQLKLAQSFSGKMPDNFQNKSFGKRHFEEKNSLGEPPIKRQLLLEFDKTENPPKSMKPSRSTPDGVFKDRRKFMYHVPLKPVTCQPLGATKERQEVKNPTLTLPDQDFKGFKSKPAIFQHCALRQSAGGASGISAPPMAPTKDSEGTRSLHKSGKAAKTFVPPFKTKATLPTGDQGSGKRCHSAISSNVAEEREPNQITADQNIAEAHDHHSCILSAAGTGLENGNSVMSRMMANLRCARDLQEMRIRKKYRQNISPQPGSLYVVKTSAQHRISLKAAVEERTPGFYSTEELYTCGVSKHCLQVNSTNAESFQFLIGEFFSKEYLLAGNGMQLADGGWLIPTDEGRAGKKEFYRALCDTPGVDPKLITEAWVSNHYRWIVWKLAAMEVSFPHEFANRCLTPETVLLQLKYRYDLEIDKSKRSAIKKITEKDDAAGKTLVLCISKIISLNTVVSPGNSNMESKKAAAIIEVTDGWYGIRALLDPPLKAFLQRRRLTVGQKIIVHGAELIGSHNGCTPLEAPDSLMLKVSANSTRCARWHAKLGFHRDPRPFPLPLSSLYSEGGAVGCIDVVVQRAYPIQWMEKTSAGSYVFRNSRADEREAARHAEDRQKKLEALFAKIQAEFEKHEERNCRRTPRSHIVTRQQIHNLQDGGELYEAIQSASDPGYMEGYLSEDQLKALNAHRQLMNDKKQMQIQEEFKKAIESAEQEKLGCSKRDVSSVWKLRVVDYRKQEKHKGVMLSIWRPLLDVCSLLKEGTRYRIYQLSASQAKGRSDSTNLHLAATKKTQYLQLPASQRMLVQIFFPRRALKFTSLLDPSFQPPCAEVDLVGVVVSLSRTGFTNMVYLSDENCNLVAVKIWADLRHLAIEDIVVRCSVISASNLQWQSEFRSEIPVLLAGDLSVFSASPKESYLQEKFNELRSVIENVDSFCSDAESKLMNLLQRSCSLTPALSKRCGLECFSPSCSSGLHAGDKSLIPSKIGVKHQHPMSASTPNMKLVPGTPSSATAAENHPRNSKKRKAMDFLSCIPAPPPLTPICSIVSPSLKKAFQPPRSLGVQRKSSKETTPNLGYVTPRRKSGESSRPPDNDLVADEELAMINTQALINAFPDDKKKDCVSTIANNVSGDLSLKNSSRS